MDEMVHRWSDRMLVDVAEPLPDTVLKSGSLLRPPAPDSVIDQAEARLGVNLPAQTTGRSYRCLMAPTPTLRSSRRRNRARTRLIRPSASCPRRS